MSDIDLKPAGIEILVHWRAFDGAGEEIIRTIVGQDGVPREDRRPFTLRIPVGTTLGGPRVTEEVLGAWLFAEREKGRVELLKLLTEERARQPEPPSLNGKGEPIEQAAPRPAEVG